MIPVPEHFYWGVATAAYQIEGAVNEDGRGESIWDRFCTVPGHILNGDTGAVADDHYHRYQEDIQLMRELGVNAYRFSIAWPRILPTGRGEVNPRGLDFYDRLVDALLAAGIEPCVTLYHWDLPQALQDQLGGWSSRETASAFADYADVVSRHLGDRVRSWMTLNEPWVSAFAGHEHGRMAPGLSDSRLAWQVSHHLLLAHGLAVAVLRANGRADTRVGIVLNQSPMEPATPTEEDEQAARESDGKLNRWFLDPLFRGSYPADVLASLGSLAPAQKKATPRLLPALSIFWASITTTALSCIGKQTGASQWFIQRMPSTPLCIGRSTRLVCANCFSACIGTTLHLNCSSQRMEPRSPIRSTTMARSTTHAEYTTCVSIFERPSRRWPMVSHWRAILSGHSWIILSGLLAMHAASASSMSTTQLSGASLKTADAGIATCLLEG